ncbi:MAG TPA: hypothetical protein VFU05_11050 [Cyclobacteriaceae bacterium]|nr:hypothetical protein [Cyclobacteriaceae bacterium]
MMTNKKIIFIIFALVVLNGILLAKYLNEKSITDLSIKLVDYPSYLSELDNQPYKSNLIVFRPNNDRIQECYNITLQIHALFGHLRKQYHEQPQFDAWVSQKIDLVEYYKSKNNLSESEKTEFKTLVDDFITSFEDLIKQPYMLADVDTSVNVKIDTVAITLEACMEEFASFKKAYSSEGEFNIRGTTYYLNDLTLVETSLITEDIQLSLNLLWRKYANACNKGELLVMKKLYPKNAR